LKYLPINSRQALQALSVLLRREETRTLPEIRACQLLYIADRESIKESGLPVCGGICVGTHRGPINKDVLDIINGYDLAIADWSEFIQKTRYMIRLINDPGVSDLSRYQMKKLEEVAKRYEYLDDFDLTKTVCRKIPEWRNNRDKQITIQETITGVGRDDHEYLIDEYKTHILFAKIFAKESQNDD